MNKPKFSVVLIARNEENHVPKMMSSLKEFQERGGEVCLLDTGSTDNTVEIAKSLGCKVQAVGDMFRITIDQDLADKINNKFVVEGETPVVNAGDSLFDFASARNYSVSFAENDMISTMDCDEVFTKLDIDKINQFIDDGYEQFEYNFVFNHDPLGNPVIKFRQSKFYNRLKTKWVGIIHEVLQGPANLAYLDENIIKLEHFQNEKTNRSGYLKGLAVDCFNNPNNDRNSHYFAREMMYCGRNKSAIKEFKNHISMGKWGTEAAQSMLYIGDCYRAMGDVDNMLLWWTKSFEKEARREPMMRIAEYYYGRGMHQQTIAYCEAALSVTQLPFYSNHVPYYENIPHEFLYTSYWWVGKKDKSKEHWEKALAFCPTNQKYISDGQFYKEITKPKITFVIPTLGREDGLKRCTDSIEALNYPKENMEVIIKQDSYENRTGVPKLVKQGVEESTGDWIVFASNDTEFTPESINEALAVGEKGYVAFNTGEVYEDGGNANEHFMIRKDIVEKIGEVFDTDFYHCGVDNLLMAKMKKLGIFVRAEKAIVNHYHFTKGAEMDKVYDLGWSHVDDDRELLKKKLAELI
jgi:glycosyltransferase involved in cell wall biosynthesis